MSASTGVDVAALGAGALGGLFSGLGQGKQSSADRKLTAQQQYLQSILAGNNANPYQQAQFAQSDAMKNALFGGGGNNISNASGSYDSTTGKGSFSGGLKLPDNFQQQISPAFQQSFTQPFAQKFQDQYSGAQGQLAQSAGLQPNGQPIPDGYEMKNGQLQKKGPGFWKKFAKIALAAAPIVAAPFTGGASLALIGAGAGAASSALSGGGLKGALLGGAMGGATAGMTGGMAKNIPGLNTLGKFGTTVSGTGSPLAAGLSSTIPQGILQGATSNYGGVNPSQYFKNVKF